MGQVRHEVNRRLRGCFTEFRFFLDYAERELKRQYGKDSTQAARFKEACSNRFAYRFVYALRNYAQHVNLPLENIALRSDGSDDRTGRTCYRFSVEVDRDALLQSGFDWRADVRTDLRHLARRFDLDPYVEEVMECLEKLHVIMVAIKIPDIRRGADRINSLVGPLKARGILVSVSMLPVPNSVLKI